MFPIDVKYRGSWDSDTLIDAKLISFVNVEGGPHGVLAVNRMMLTKPLSMIYLKEPIE